MFLFLAIAEDQNALNCTAIVSRPKNIAKGVIVLIAVIPRTMKRKDKMQ